MIVSEAASPMESHAASRSWEVWFLYPDTPCMPYMPIKSPPKPPQLIGSPMAVPLVVPGIYSSHPRTLQVQRNWRKGCAESPDCRDCAVHVPCMELYGAHGGSKIWGSTWIDPQWNPNRRGFQTGGELHQTMIGGSGVQMRPSLPVIGTLTHIPDLRHLGVRPDQ